jgi:integrase
MPPIKMKNGPYRVRSKGKEYWYAWRNGPRLLSTPGTQAFLQEIADAVAARQAPDTSKVSGLVGLYRASSYFLEDLAPSTRDLWNPWLDKIRDRFGALSIRQFDRPAIKPEITRWHHSMKSTPRAADTGLQVLSRVLAFGMSQGKLGSNQCEGMAHLHKSNRADVIWGDEDFATLLAHASPEMAWAARLAALTGLRRGDLVKLAWSHVGEFAIEMKTGKSNERVTVTIPMTKDLRDLLAVIPKRATTVLTSSDKRPWTGDGLGSSFWKVIQKAGLKDKGLRFHDFRGTAATRLYRAHLSLREIAEVLGWSEDRVEKIINRYVKRDEILKDRIRRIEQAQQGPDALRSMPEFKG